MSNDTISYLENGHEFTVHFDELLKYHGAGYPGGVVHGLKVMQRAWPLLDNGRLPERREIRCVTAFGGPGVEMRLSLLPAVLLRVATLLITQ